MLERTKLPIAVPITVAFHVRMKMAPAPYTKAKRTEKARTLMLLRKMSEKMASWLMALELTLGVLMAWMVLVWRSKAIDAMSLGSTTYQSMLETVMPRKRYMRNDIALLCSCRRRGSESIAMSLLSSSLITLYMMGIAAITMKSSMTMLASSRKIQSESKIATEEYTNPMKNIS